MLLFVNAVAYIVVVNVSVNVVVVISVVTVVVEHRLIINGTIYAFYIKFPTPHV